MAAAERVDGQTVLGSRRLRGAAKVDSLAGTASGIVLIDSAGVEYVLWVDNAGELVIGTRTGWVTPDTVPGNASAKKVGAQ